MGHVVTFDTVAYAKKLIAAGVPAKQAEVQAETLADLVNEQIVSRQYLDIRLSEMEMRLKYDLTLRFGIMLAAAVAVIAALIKLLH